VKRVTRRGFLKSAAATAAAASLTKEAEGGSPTDKLQTVYSGTIPKLSPGSVQSVESYEQRITKHTGKTGERYCAVVSPHIAYFTPEAHLGYARLVVPILEQAYGKLKDWHAGVEPKHRISIEHYPLGHPQARGGTSGCVLFYTYQNLGMMEGRNRKVPHVIGYTEEIAHNFDGACGMWGWLYEGLGNYAAQNITPEVAPCRELDRFLARVEKIDGETHAYYVRHGRLPPGVGANLRDRLVRQIFRILEPAAEGHLLPKFYQRLKDRGRLPLKMPGTGRFGENYIVSETLSDVTGKDAFKLFRQCHFPLEKPLNW